MKPRHYAAGVLAGLMLLGGSVLAQNRGAIEPCQITVHADAAVTLSDSCVQATPTPGATDGPTPAPAPTVDPTPAPTGTPAPQPTSTPAPPPTVVPTATPTPQATVDLADWTQPAWGTGQINPPGAGGGAAFRTFCDPGQVGQWDPIVTGGGLGPHLHQFFGNLTITQNTATGDIAAGQPSTCQGGPLNSTGYWTPTLHSAGDVVAPQKLEVYYKAQHAGGRLTVAALPPGLVMIGGAPTLDEWGGPTHQWYCLGPGTPKYPSIEALAATRPDCGPFSLRASIRFPFCWDGVNLDTPDHRSHVIFPPGGGACPQSHPVHIPEISELVDYPPGLDLSTLRLSSDGPDTAAGASLHADWAGAWDPRASGQWLETCLRQDRSCSGGDLGDGTQLWGRSPEGD